jgi:surface protein
MDSMLSSCYSLAELRLDNCSYDTISKIINSSNLPTDATMDGGARTIYCKKENAAGLTAPEGWVFSYVDEPSISLYVSGEFQNNKEITEVRTMVDESHYDLSYMFSGCSNLISVNTEDWDTSTISNMRSMFYECTSLTQLDLSNFNTAMVGFMSSMFYNCTSLTTLNLSNWDTSGLFIPEMETEFMFSGCSSLRELRLDNCSNDTINRIINSSGFPTNAIEGVTRTIYCKEANAAGLTAPTNWVFSYIDEEPEQGGGTSGSGSNKPSNKPGNNPGGGNIPGKPSNGS